jgi:hypothetical protein
VVNGSDDVITRRCLIFISTAFLFALCGPFFATTSICDCRVVIQSRPTVRTREEHAEKADQTVPIIPGTVRPCSSAFPGTSASHARIGRDSRQDR